MNVWTVFAVALIFGVFSALVVVLIDRRMRQDEEWSIIEEEG